MLLHAQNSIQCGNISLQIYIRIENWGHTPLFAILFSSLLRFRSQCHNFLSSIFFPLLKNHFVPFFASGAVCSMSRMCFPFIRALYIPLLCSVAHVLFVAFVIFTSSFFLFLFHLKVIWKRCMWNGWTIEVNTTSSQSKFYAFIRIQLVTRQLRFIWL